MIIKKWVIITIRFPLPRTSMGSSVAYRWWAVRTRITRAAFVSSSLFYCCLVFSSEYPWDLFWIETLLVLHVNNRNITVKITANFQWTMTGIVFPSIVEIYWLQRPTRSPPGSPQSCSDARTTRPIGKTSSSLREWLSACGARSGKRWANSELQFPKQILIVLLMHASNVSKSE